jgi:imidazolonepropionase-like amidohydrolase
MRRSAILVIGIFAAAVLTRAEQREARPKEPITLAIAGGRLIDGYGSTPIENSVVLVSGKRVAQVGTLDTVAIPKGVQTISSEGMTVMPGLIDMHVHFIVIGHNDYGFWFPFARTRVKELTELSAKMLLAQGVTTVKDCAGPIPDIVNLRDAINRGELLGPRAIVTGPFLQKTNTPASDYLYWSVSSVEDARQKLKKLIDAGVDQIKTAQSAALGQQLVDFIVQETHRAGKHVTVHVNSEEDMLVALRAGVDARDTFEHVGDGPAIAYSDELMAGLRRSGVGLVPTVIAIEGIMQLERFPEYADIQELRRDLPPELYELVHGSYIDTQRHPLFTRGKDNFKGRRAKLRQLREAGLDILMGTDSGTRGNPHQLAAWRELEIMTEYGLTPMEALRAATFFNARNLGLSNEIGTVAPGKTADIIVIDGDPLTGIRDMRRVKHVVKEGVQFR